jgi:hypothetical protein
MNNDEIDKLNSVELNYLVHEKIFGHARPPYVHLKDDDGIEYGWNTPNYSGDIRAAWEVVDFLKDKHYTSPDDSNYITANFVKLEYFNDKWVVKIQGKIPSRSGGMGIASAFTAPVAICRAALKSVLGDEENT